MSVSPRVIFNSKGLIIEQYVDETPEYPAGYTVIQITNWNSGIDFIGKRNGHNRGDQFLKKLHRALGKHLYNL